jgi:GNAT superfamily N-acetyltransferase
MALRASRKPVYALFFDPGTLTRVLKQFLQENSVFIAENGHGMLVGMKRPFIYGVCDTAIELSWWVDEEYRNTGLGKELLKAFEDWAKENNCKFMTMVSLDDHAGHLYEKLGYTLAERTYMKVIN